MNELFRELLKAYGLNPEAVRIKPFGEGHIHDTYLVEQDGPPLLLQHINHHVFRDIKLLMENMERITAHISYKNRKAGKDPAKNGIVLVESEGGKSWVGNETSGYWRMFWYIENQHSYDIAENEKIAYEGGKAVGNFQEMLSDLDPGQVGESIPNFHDFYFRKQQFNDALKNTTKERIHNAGEIVELTGRYGKIVEEIYQYSKDNKIPGRLTHNDTKFNNMLFNRDGKVTCLIDLDTVMSGYSWFDFGDALRTSASMVSEEEQDMNLVGFRTNIFSEFARGYIESATFLEKSEIDILHKAPLAFTIMQGMRFLTDYLSHDVYYKTTYPDQNLVRARNQYTLAGVIMETLDELKNIIVSLRTGK